MQPFIRIVTYKLSPQVEEEIGYDIGGHVNPEDFLEVEIAEQRCRLYIVTGVEESTPFLTRTKKEIGVSAADVVHA